MEDPVGHSPKIPTEGDIWGDALWDINKALAGNTLGIPKTQAELKALVTQADDIAKAIQQKYGDNVPDSLKADLGVCARRAKENNIPTEHLKRFISGAISPDNT